MKEEEVKNLIPVLQAFVDGKEIEGRPFGNSSEQGWMRVYRISNIDSIEYRIKPKLKPKAKYRPFASAEECWEEMQKHQPFGWITGLLEGNTHFLIICVRNNNYPITCNGGHTIFLPFDKLCNCYTFADGTPFGIKEE